MDPEWQHAHMCLKLGNFYPITYKINHTKNKSQIHSSVSQNKGWSWVEKKKIVKKRRVCTAYKPQSPAQKNTMFTVTRLEIPEDLEYDACPPLKIPIYLDGDIEVFEFN